MRIKNDQIVNTDDEDEEDDPFDGLFSDEDDSKWETDDEESFGRGDNETTSGAEASTAKIPDSYEVAPTGTNGGLKMEEKEQTSYLNGGADDDLDSVFANNNNTNAASTSVMTARKHDAAAANLASSENDEDAFSSEAEVASPLLNQKLLNYQHFERDETEIAFESDLDMSSTKKTGVNTSAASVSGAGNKLNKHNSLSTSDSDLDSSSDSSSSSSSSSSDSSNSSSSSSLSNSSSQSSSSSDEDTSSSGDDDDDDDRFKTNRSKTSSQVNQSIYLNKVYFLFKKVYIVFLFYDRS